MSRFFIIFCAVCFFCLPLRAQTEKETEYKIKPGVKAPDLHIIKWAKGKPMPAFKKGHVYVVEFSTVGCTPCRKSIPHLSLLAEQFAGKATIIGVYFGTDKVKDDTKELRYVKSIQNFTNAMGDKISYSIAADVPKQVTYETWMKASGNMAIPTAFIVDRSGLIAWIGHPLYLNHAMLSQVVAGKFDIAANNNKQSIENKKLAVVYARIFEAKKQGDHATAFRVMDSLIEASPEVFKINHFYAKFEVLKHADNEMAAAWLQWMLDNRPANFDWFHLAADIFLWSSQCREKGLDENKAFELGVKVTNRAIEEAESPVIASYSLNILAGAWFNKGDVQKAIRAQEQAIEKILPFKDAEKDQLEYYIAALNAYKKKLANND